MKIGYFADGPWSHCALASLVKLDGVEIVFITPRFDTQDPVLKEWANKLNVPFIVHPDVNSDDFIDHIKTYQADLLVSMSFNQILKTDIINLAPKGFINCHAGALPFYRGRNPLNWVLINDEKEYGITVHMVDEGIDTGDVILRKLFPISDLDNYSTLLDRAVIECGKILCEAVTLFRDGEVVRIPQSTIHPIGFYCGMRKVGDEIINFNNTSRSLFNFIRAITLPGPGARAVVLKKNISILSAKIIENAPNYIGTTGEVVGRQADGVVVKTKDSTILLTQVADVSESGELVNQRIPTYRIGTRIETP